MKKILELPVEDGGTVRVEVDEVVDRAPMRGMQLDRVTERAQLSFDAATGQIKTVAQTLIAQLRGVDDAPDEIAVEFGLQLSGEVGAFITSAAAQANFRVSLTWRARHPMTGR